MKVRFASIAAALLLVAVLAWTAGLQHQANCIDAGRVGCSVLPWKDGHAPKSDGFGLSQQDVDRLLGGP